MNRSVRNYCVVLALWLAMATAVGASDAPAVQTTGGVATIVQMKNEFKPVVDGTEITVDFPIRNTGQEVLAIQQVRTG